MTVRIKFYGITSDMNPKCYNERQLLSGVSTPDMTFEIKAGGCREMLPSILGISPVLAKHLGASYLQNRSEISDT